MKSSWLLEKHLSPGGFIQLEPICFCSSFIPLGLVKGFPMLCFSGQWFVFSQYHILQSRQFYGGISAHVDNLKKILVYRSEAWNGYLASEKLVPLRKNWLTSHPNVDCNTEQSRRRKIYLQFSQFSSVNSAAPDPATAWTAARQTSLSITNSRSLLKLMSIESVMPSNHLILCHHSPPAFSFLASGSFPMSQLFTSGGQTFGVSASASVLPMNAQDWFPLGWLVGSPWSPGDPQESSPTPQFKGINSLLLSFLYCPTLTFIHDYWKNHSLD